MTQVCRTTTEAASPKQGTAPTAYRLNISVADLVRELEAGLATELPHLACTVDLRDETIYVKAVQA